ncbi:MAG TPA: lysophospholipid acyltransferase family protein [Caulobacteraceae bacterium]
MRAALRVFTSLLFTVWLYLSIAIASILYLPALLGPRRFMNKLVSLWAWQANVAFQLICGVRVEVRGRERLPKGAALLAGKHQSMFDIVAPYGFLDDPCFVMKHELMQLPLFGWHARKTGMISVDRSAGATALKKMVADTRDRLQEERQIVIFPEGTRTIPGAEPDYKPGVAALYRDLDVPCYPVATNSGACWPAHGLMKRPGKVVYEILEPIPAGLKRSQFMSELETRIETASTALLAESKKT